MLLNLAIAAFEKARWPAKVLTGRYAFQLGGGSRNVAHEPEDLHDSSFEDHSALTSAAILGRPHHIHARRRDRKH
jgi:hypothetical protein